MAKNATQKIPILKLQGFKEILSLKKELEAELGTYYEVEKLQ